MTDIAYNVLKSPEELKPHELNTEIYGNEVPDDDLVESINRKGILEPLVILENNTILSGHRRWIASKSLHLQTIPCRIVSFSDKLDEEEALIEFNRQRKKTVSQTMKEAEHLLNIESERNRLKQAHGQTAPGRTLVPMLAQAFENDIKTNQTKEKTNPKTRDIIAEKIGMSHGQYDKARTVYDASQNGNKLAKKLIESVDKGSKTINSAYNEFKKDVDLQRKRLDLSQKSEMMKSLPDTIKLHHADFLKDYKLIEKESIDCIITDPPYVREWLDNYENFAIAAQYVLKPGGFLITYIGHIHLDNILNQMTKYLDYYWIMCLKHSGSTKAVHSRYVQCGMKPILILQKPPKSMPKRYFNDLIIGSGREKNAHEWQQGEDELLQIFNPFTDPGDIVLDPFMGSGTVVSVANKMNRRVIGFDIDKQNVDIVKGRLSS